MNPTDAIATVVFFGGAACIMYGPWQTACTDYFRQPLFEQRDRLFEMAAAGRLSFESEAYITLRRSINAHIRYAHMASLPRFAFHVLFNGRPSGAPTESALAIAAIQDADLQADLERISLACAKAVFWLLVAKSPAIWVCVLLATPLIALGLVLGVGRAVATSFLVVFGRRLDNDARQSDLALSGGLIGTNA